MQSTWDLIVVGAGILGSSHAYFAAQRGWRVLLLERSDWPAEASVRNFGTLMAGSLAGEWRRRGLESIAWYRELAPRAGFEFQPCGSLYHVTTDLEATLLEEFASLGAEKSGACELMQTTRALRINPLLRIDQVRLALFFPGDARVEPRGLLRKLIPWMTSEWKVDYRPATVAIEVTGRQGEARVRTADGADLYARHVVICNGSDLRTLFPERFKQAGFQRCKLLMMRTVAQPQLRLPTNLASGLTLRRYPAFAQCPSWNKLANEPVASGVLENGIHILMVQDPDGSFVVGDSHTYSAGDHSEVLNSHIENLILSEAQKLVELQNWTIAERWHGIYGMPKDAELYRETIDAVIHIVTGIRGKGMTTGPAVARETIDALTNDSNSPKKQ
jgi:FAD dependent oxidoreductase TIGR03364